MLYNTMLPDGSENFLPVVRHSDVFRHRVVESKLERFICKKFKVNFLSDIDLSLSECASKYKQLLSNMVLSCRSCRCAVETSYSHCSPIYTRNPVAVCIGRSPSKAEALMNQVVEEHTQCGRIFNQYLEMLGISKSDVAVLNMVQCHTFKNRPPELECVNKCCAFKRFEFYYINRFKILFLMGNDAMSWFYGRNSSGVMPNLGRVYMSRLDKSWLDLGVQQEIIVIPVVHPNALVINPHMRNDVAKILKMTSKIITQIKEEMA